MQSTNSTEWTSSIQFLQFVRLQTHDAVRSSPTPYAVDDGGNSPVAVLLARSSHEPRVLFLLPSSPLSPDRHHLPTGRVRKPRARSAVEWNSSPSEPCVSIARVGGAAHTSSTSPTIPPCLSFAHRREPTSPEPQRHRHELTAELDPQSIVPRFLAPLSSHTPQLSPRPLRSASPSPYAGNGAPLSPHCRRRPSPWNSHFPTSSESKINLGLPSRAPWSCRPYPSSPALRFPRSTANLAAAQPLHGRDSFHGSAFARFLVVTASPHSQLLPDSLCLSGSPSAGWSPECRRRQSSAVRRPPCGPPYAAPLHAHDS